MDSVGCYVFWEKIDFALDLYGANYRWHGVTGAAALVTAHEIGHALGITEHTYAPTYSVMGDRDLDALFQDPTEYYERYAKFLDESLNHSNYHWNVFPQRKSSVNLRDVLGITTVDIGS